MHEITAAALPAQSMARHGSCLACPGHNTWLSCVLLHAAPWRLPCRRSAPHHGGCLACSVQKRRKSSHVRNRGLPVPVSMVWAAVVTKYSAAGSCPWWPWLPATSARQSRVLFQLQAPRLVLVCADLCGQDKAQGQVQRSNIGSHEIPLNNVSLMCVCARMCMLTQGICGRAQSKRMEAHAKLAPVTISKLTAMRRSCSSDVRDASLAGPCSSPNTRTKCARSSTDAPGGTWARSTGVPC